MALQGGMATRPETHLVHFEKVHGVGLGVEVADVELVNALDKVVQNLMWSDECKRRLPQ